MALLEMWASLSPIEKIDPIYPVTNKNLVDNCIKGKESAQKELFLRFRSYAMGICLRYAKNEDEAIDIAQDSFIKIFKSIKQLKDSDLLKSWIRKIVVHQCIDFYHKNVKHDHDEIANALDINDENHQDALGDLATEEILVCINRLPDGYRLVFNMYVIEGYNHDEIAEKLGISEVTSRTQLFKARKILKKQLTTNCHEIKKFI